MKKVPHKFKKLIMSEEELARSGDPYQKKCFVSFTISLNINGKPTKFGEYLQFSDVKDYIPALRNLVRIKHSYLRHYKQDLLQNAPINSTDFVKDTSNSTKTQED